MNHIRKILRLYQTIG